MSAMETVNNWKADRGIWLMAIQERTKQMIKGRNDNIKKSAIKEDNKEVSNIHGLLGSRKSVQ